MKKIAFLSLLIALVITITGCNNNSQFKLQITESSWSGWTEDYEPEEVTKEYDVILGKEYSIGSNFTFVVNKINSNSIVIKTTEPFSDNEKGIDLMSKKTDFTIYINKKLKLTTPTMDAGDIYYLSLIKSK